MRHFVTHLRITAAILCVSIAALVGRCDGADTNADVAAQTLGKVTSTTVEPVVLTTNTHKGEKATSNRSNADPLVEAVTQAIGTFPSPYAPLASAAFSALAGAYLAYRNRQKVSEELVRNIEDVRKAVRATGGHSADDQVVKFLEESQRKSRTHRSIRSILRKQASSKTEFPASLLREKE